jgi:hypothetical protein
MPKLPWTRESERQLDEDDCTQLPLLAVWRVSMNVSRCGLPGVAVSMVTVVTSWILLMVMFWSFETAVSPPKT